MIPVARPCFGEEEERAVAAVLRSGWVAQGPETVAFEREFAGYVGVSHAVATSSCTTALHLAVEAAGIGPGDEVLFPAYTFPATANAVLHAGGTPVPVDIDPVTLNLDAKKTAAAVTPRTKAVIAVHLFGCACPMSSLESLCREHDLFLIEDAACAVGTMVEGRPAGSVGRVACFSFHARKVLTSGEGGMLTTDDESTAHLLRSLRNHGADRSAEERQKEGSAPPAPRFGRPGYNYRISDIQSAVGRVQLSRLPAFLKERRELAERYAEGLAGLSGLRLPPLPGDAGHSFQSFVVVLDPPAPVDAPALMGTLADQGISTRIGTFAVHREPYFADLFPQIPALPEAEHAAQASVALPLYNGLSVPDQDRVIRALHAIW
ncbi:MAG: DegT/DnrJ/EryC1/StrS family aminotransferase [Gemmatimonadota bacterium]|nr:DegT/DnrJ/EryC1/StrS family aminotransferase [Gemmatimonadota bacterium]MDP6803096.1 DegT/DnrJ/EryC1/StrS family aminotransferase [Gemmatimonadota bacterium]MDP7031865.1 DegT/DnrJ/EryC1/StrS family aminotransferase [Gemmatimonadota bacterium]